MLFQVGLAHAQRGEDVALGNTTSPEEKDLAREKAREEARTKLEELSAKSKEPPKPLPEFGSGDDFPLAQALNQLKGQPVAVSKTHVERKAALDSDKQ